MATTKVTIDLEKTWGMQIGKLATLIITAKDLADEIKSVMEAFDSVPATSAVNIQAACGTATEAEAQALYTLIVNAAANLAAPAAAAKDYNEAVEI